MGVIMHNNIPYGGGSSIEPNPQESATEQLETLGIDGDVYEVTDANAAREVQETITEAQSRANLADGDSVPTIFGKIKKFFSDLKTVAFTGAYSDLSGTPTIPTVNDGTLTIQKNGTNVQTFSANQSGNATANIECATPSDVEGSKVATGNPLTITDAAGIKAEKIVIEFEPKQAGSGTPSPSNIRPITGYTSISANRCGKNTLNVNGTDTSNGYINGVYLTNTNSTASGFDGFVSEYMYIFEDKDKLTLNGLSGTNPSICFFDKNKTFISGVKYSNSFPKTVDIPSDAAYYRASVPNSDKNTAIIEYGSSPSPYDPFKGDSVLVQLGQTLYGCKLTILQDGSADVDVTYCFSKIRNISNWSTQSGTYGRFYCFLNGTDMPKAYYNREEATYLSDIYNSYSDANKPMNTDGIYMGLYNNEVPVLKFWDSEYTYQADLEAWRTARADNEICYKLATPFTIHLSPVETLNLLQGINNVWTDGTTLSLTYQPDNAIGQAKGTAQDAMAMVNALASTAVKVIAKKGQYEMGVRDWVDMPDCSLSLDKGTYVIIGWLSCNSDMLYYNGNYYRYGCAICDSSNNRLVCNTFLPSTTTEIVYGGTISTFYYEKITSDATVRKLKGYMPYTLSGSKIAYGGIVAIKIA